MSRLNEFSEVIICDDALDHEIKPGTIYVEECVLYFACPCGCGLDFRLPIRGRCQWPEDVPKWDLSIKNNRVTITPSVNYLSGCKSHFWIKNNHVLWCS